MASGQDSGGDTSREIIVAMELLRASISRFHETFLANAQKSVEPENKPKGKGKKDEPKDWLQWLKEKSQGGYDKAKEKIADRTPGGMKTVNTMETLFKTLLAPLAKFAAILIPLGALGSIIGGMMPGLKLVSSAFNLLGATLLPLFMPLFVTLATVVMMVSDTLWKALEPALEGIYGAIFSTVIPALDALADAFDGFIMFLDQLFGKSKGHKGRDMSGQEKIAEENEQAVRKAALAEGKTKEEADRLAGLAKHGGGSAEDMAEAERLRAKGMTPEQQAEREKARQAGATKGGGSMALREVMQEMRQSMGRQASFNGIGQAGKNFQLAALNTSPFEAKIIDRMDKMMSKMDRQIELNSTSKDTSVKSK